MIRNVTQICLWLIPVGVTMAYLPIQVQARHRIDYHLLLPAVENLHFQVERFERMADRRWFPQHELKYMEIMVKRSCRLVEGVSEYAPRGRVLADYNVLNAFIRTVDRRLSRRSAAQSDYRLMKSWQSLTYDFEGIACLINGCSGKCGYRSAGHLVPDFIGPRLAPHHGHVGQAPPPRRGVHRQPSAHQVIVWPPITSQDGKWHGIDRWHDPEHGFDQFSRRRQDRFRHHD